MKTSNKVYKLLGVLLFSVLLVTSCNEDFEEIPEDNTIVSKKESLGKPLMSMSFDIKTSKDFETAPLNLSSLDLASMNPSNEKQHIQIQLFENGQMNLIIEEIDFKRKINIKHKILPDDTPKTVKTEIIGNMANFYDRNGKLLNSVPIKMPNQLALVEKIKNPDLKASHQDMSNIIASIQGQDNYDLDGLIKNASKNGGRVMEQGKNHITLRMPKERIGDTEIETVLLIDKTVNNIVGSRLYGTNNELIQRTYFGYNKGEYRYLNAIKQEEKIKLPSGKKMNMLTNTKIDNFKLNINI